MARPSAKISQGAGALTGRVSGAVLFQLALLGAIGAVVYIGAGNAIDNLADRKIASGFGFFNHTAGFGINQTLIPFDVESSTYGRVFVIGLLNTLLVAVLGILFATVLGFTVGISALSRNWIVRRLAGIYVEGMRNIPLLLHLFFWYFAVLRPLPLPAQALNIADGIFLSNRGLYFPKPVLHSGGEIVWLVLGLGLAVFAGATIWNRHYAQRSGARPYPAFLTAGGVVTVMLLAAYAGGLIQLTFDLPVFKGFNFTGGIAIIPELAAMVLALSLYTAAFIAETVRAGIKSVSAGQSEAAWALGLKHAHALHLVILPQAARVIIPLLTSQYLNLTKNSSLAVAIAYPDLVSVFAGTTLNQTGQAVEILLITMGVYLAFSLATAAFMNWFNARGTQRGAGHD